MIAVNMQSQVDSDGHQCQVMKGISDNSADGSALERSDGFKRSFGGNLHAKKTTRGQKLEAKWKDGTLSQTKLKYLKASNHVEPTEYAVAKIIED